MKPKKPVLIMAQYHLSTDKAEKHVSILLKTLGLKKPKGGWHSTSYTLKTPKGEINLIWKEMVNEVRISGGVAAIENWLDMQNPIFGGSFGMAVGSSHMNISTTFLGQTKKFKGPARSYPVEQEIAGDILEFRRLCCDSSLPGDFSETSRFFRAYLFSCISLVDAFINRYVHIANYKGKSSPLSEQLKIPGRLEDRLSLWLQAFGTRGDAELRKGTKWDHFNVLKKARNLHIHATEPYFGYQVSSMIAPLNACRMGIGGLLKFLQNEAGQKPISLIHKLTSAPVIRFSEK